MKKLLIITIIVGLAACGDDGGGQVASPDADVAGDSSAPARDTGLAPDTASVVDTSRPQDTAPPAPNALVYADSMFGGDGLPCADQCAWSGDAGAEFSLAVVYRDGAGLPLVDRQVKFSIDASPELAKLSALSGYTDPQGRASVTLRTFDIPGTVTVVAKVASDPDAGELSFVVTLAVPAAPVLLASPSYVGQAGVADFQLRLFKQHAGQPSCGSVHPDAGGVIPEPDEIAGPYGYGQQAAIMDLPGLAEEAEQRWVVQFVGPAEGVELAVGCVDGVVVRSGETAQELVYVLDLPPSFRGPYRSITRIDLVTGATGTLGSVIGGTVQLFTEPGVLILGWACQGASGTLGTICGFLLDDDGRPTIAGGVITDAADAALIALIASNLGENVTQVGQTVSELLRDLRLLSNLGLGSEPASPMAGFEGAYFAPGEAREEWTHVRFRWRFDALCKPSGGDDQECGWTDMPLEEVYGFRPTATLAAGVDLGLALHIEPHEVPGMTYGPLVNAIFERRLLPLMFGDGSNGLPPVDSWEDLVSVLLGDDRCLLYDDCCEFFTSRIEDQVYDYLVPFIPAACEAAIPAAASLIRNQLLALDGAIHLGTPPGGGCASRDGDGDRWIDMWGSQAQPCAWDLYFPTSDGRFEPDSDWRAARQ